MAWEVEATQRPFVDRSLRSRTQDSRGGTHCPDRRRHIHCCAQSHAKLGQPLLRAINHAHGMRHYEVRTESCALERVATCIRTAGRWWRRRSRRDMNASAVVGARHRGVRVAANALPRTGCSNELFEAHCRPSLRCVCTDRSTDLSTPDVGGPTQRTSRPEQPAVVWFNLGLCGQQAGEGADSQAGHLWAMVKFYYAPVDHDPSNAYCTMRSMTSCERSWV